MNKTKKLLILVIVLMSLLLMCVAACICLEIRYQNRISVVQTIPTQSTSAPAEETVTEPPTIPTETAPPEETEPPETEAQTEPQTQPLPEPEDHEFVRVQDYIPDIVVDLRYATENNFTGQKIYDFTDAWLRYGTVKKLMAVQDALQQQGLSLKIWDAFRPPAAQFKLWEVYPVAEYVANPNGGNFSPHSRGHTVDITLVDMDGNELEMPTGFDDFSHYANRDYSDCTETAAANARLLEDLMEENGFTAYYSEWWHYVDTTRYDVEQEFIPR